MKIAFVLMFASVAACAESLKHTDLAKLQDPSTRDTEVRRLVDCEEGDYTLLQYRILTANQKDGAPPLRVLCAAYAYKSSLDETPYGGYKIEKPEELFGETSDSVFSRTEPSLDPVRDSALLIFDSKGREIQPFGGNNYTNEGYYYDFDHDGILDRADSTNYSVKEAPNDSVQVFELQSIEPKPRTLLEVVFNWHPRSDEDRNDWNFTCFDEDKDGFVEIAFGPASATTPEEQRKFVFRWDPAAKCYSAGEIPKHAHIRVLKSRETLASIAKSGALGYPVIKDPSAQESNTPPTPSSQAPYVFRSLKDRPDSEWAAFFQGKAHRDVFSGPEDSFPNQIPENFWTLTPKQAALAIAEANRTPTHRKRWKLALDDRENMTPPASGWLIHDWGSSGCYSYTSHLFALHFGVPNPSLTVFEYNSIGVVGRNPWADQPAHTARFISLTGQEARFLADTVFWLDRIRTFSPTHKNHSFGGRSCTADGFATLSIYPDHAPPVKLAGETVWATSSISANWDSDYTKTTFINLAEWLVADSFPAKLGKRWNIAPEIGHHSLATPTGERLSPRVDADARQQLSETYSAVLERHAKNPIPAPALEELIRAAGSEALTELLPALQNLLDTLPAENAEDKEFATLQKRFERDHFGNPLEDDPSDHKKAYARHTKLRELRAFIPSAVLRKPLTDSIRKLRLAGNVFDLSKAAAGNGPDAAWALTQIHRMDPDVWSNLVASQFADAGTENRRTILNTLAASHPAKVKRLIDDLSTRDYRDLIIEITRFHQKHDAESIPKDLPLLMALIKDRKQDYIRRSEAMDLMAGCVPTTSMREDLITLLANEIQNPRKGGYGMNTLDSAVRALTRVSGSADHLELITTTPNIVNEAFEAGFEAILRMAKDRPDRDQLLADYIRPRFTKSNGMMDDIFLHGLAWNLRSLAPGIATFASENPTVADGDGADYSGGNFKTPVGRRYHIAREITALWSEPDPATTARMWVFFIAAHPYQFDPEHQNSQMGRVLCEFASTRIRCLPAAQRRESIDSALSLIRIPKYSASTEIWLRKLGQD